MVGDSESDILAGKVVGCKTILIGEDSYGQDYMTNSLWEPVEEVFGAAGDYILFT